MAYAPIIDRIKQLDLPSDQYIVIGSGVMDALGLRKSHDIDLVVSEELFSKLTASGRWHAREQYGIDMLEGTDVEIWPSWYHNGYHLNLLQLQTQSIRIEGILFVSPEFLLDWKEAASRAKDMPDIPLLKEYLGRA